MTMMPREHWSLSTRLVGLGLVAALLCSSVGGWLLRTQLHGMVLRSFEQGLQERANRLQDELLAYNPPRMLGRAKEQGDFGRIFSGWYWVLVWGTETWRSRSLWDDNLALTQTQPLAQHSQLMRLSDPRGAPLLGKKITLVLGEKPAQLYVFGPMQETAAELRRIDQVLLLAQGGFLMALLLWTALQVRLGLAPLRRLRRALIAVHDGKAPTLGLGYGPDLTPIAQAIDTVLTRNIRVVERARHQAADLSHALKKPLALLAVQARDTSVCSELLRTQVQAMSHTIDRHLSRFGSGAGSLDVVDVPALLASLVTLMQQLHAPRGLQWQVQVLPDVRWTGAACDLEEMVGNLLDNAGKWARHSVRVQARTQTQGLQILVEDDGPGLAPAQQQQTSMRGVRFDETVEGHGLGLAIVQDIATTYAGECRFGTSALGGLVCDLRLGCSA